MNKNPQMDWQQVMLNGGPPCFFVEGPQYCGRAERWQGHGNKAFHDYVSLDSLLTDAATRMRNRCVEKVRELRDKWWATYNSQPESLRDPRFMKGMDAAAGQLLAALQVAELEQKQGESVSSEKPKKVNLGGGAVKIQ